MPLTGPLIGLQADWGLTLTGLPAGPDAVCCGISLNLVQAIIDISSTNAWATSLYSEKVDPFASMLLSPWLAKPATHPCNSKSHAGTFRMLIGSLTEPDAYWGATLTESLPGLMLNGVWRSVHR